MKIAVHVVRTLLALLFLWGGIAYFFKLGPQEAPTGPILTYVTGIELVHTMPIIKFIEALCGLLLLINILAPLANVLLFPIVVNIFLVHTFLDPSKIIVPIVILILQLFLAFAYRKNYAGLLSAKPL